MTKKDDVRYIKKCVDEIAKNKHSEDMLYLLNFMCNLMANDVGSGFLRGASIARDFTIEELKVKVSYIGDRVKTSR
jgi:hypothetical protein